MATATAKHTIELDREAELWLVLDADGQHIGDGETREAAELESCRILDEERREGLRSDIEGMLWDASLETLERIRALLGS